MLVGTGLYPRNSPRRQLPHPVETLIGANQKRLGEPYAEQKKTLDFPAHNFFDLVTTILCLLSRKK